MAVVLKMTGLWAGLCQETLYFSEARCSGGGGVTSVFDVPAQRPSKLDVPTS